MNMMTSPVAADTDRSAWEGALAKFLASIEAVKAAGGDDDAASAMVEASKAEIELMTTPAPDGAALLEKMDICEANGSDDIRVGGAKVKEAIRADVERLTFARRAVAADEEWSKMRCDWEAALSDYRAKLAISDAMPEGHQREDEAVDQYCEAQDYLIEQAAAPGPRELAIKIEMALKRAEGFVDIIFKDHAEGIAADFYRITGIDPLRSTAKAWIDRWEALGGDFGMSYNSDGSERGMLRGIPEPSFWTPPAEQNPQLRPHEWIIEKSHHSGAVKLLGSLLTLVPGLENAVFSIAAGRRQLRRIHGLG